MLPTSRSPQLPEDYPLPQQQYNPITKQTPPIITPQDIQLDIITGEANTASKNYSARLSKERYAAARCTLPVGNFDWTEYKSKGTAQKEKKKFEWSWKIKLVLGIVIVLVVAALTLLVIHILSPADKSLHEKSVQPSVPTFYEVSGLMNAPKLQPLAAAEEHARAIRHLLRAGQ